MITHPELVSTLKKPGSAILATLSPEKADAWHMASCIPGEAAELFEALRNNDRDNALEELGDIQFYVEGIRQAYGITRQETLTTTVIMFVPEDVVKTSGIVFDVVKKHVIYNKDFDRAALVTALTHFELALAAFAIYFGLTYEETLAHNIAKLSVRYNGLKYSDKAAQDRADKADEVAVQNVAASQSTFRVQDDPAKLA